MMRWRPAVTAAALAVFLTGCAADPMTGHIRAERRPAEGENANASQAEVVARVAAATAARGDTAMAASLYRRAHALDRDNFAAALGLARMLGRLGAHDEAADAYRAALNLRPEDAEGLRGLGNTLVVLNQPAAALQQYERALAGTNDPRLYNGLGVASDMLDEYKVAQAYYRTGLELAPDNMELANNLGLSLMLSGDRDGAVRVLRRVAGGTRAKARHRLNLALALVLSGESRAAVEVARMDLDPASANAQVAWFETLRAIADPKAMREAIGAHLTGAVNGG